MTKQLHLIPVSIHPDLEVKSFWAKETVRRLQHFIVENERTARRYLKKVHPEIKQNELRFKVIDKRAEVQDFADIFSLYNDADEVGLLSEAGVPCVADPGGTIVMQAHRRNIKVIPHTGPSSILLALMGSGLNGQSFAFNGYLPIHETDRKKAIRRYEQQSRENVQTQIFIETPYRNKKLFDSLSRNLNDRTLLSIACDLSTSNEWIATKTVQEWKKFSVPNLHKRPCIFSYLAAD